MNKFAILLLADAETWIIKFKNDFVTVKEMWIWKD